MRGNEEDICQCLDALGIVTENADVATRTKMAFGMFDTRGKVSSCQRWWLAAMTVCLCACADLLA